LDECGGRKNFHQSTGVITGQKLIHFVSCHPVGPQEPDVVLV
jgi:hypothetical protein